MSDNVIVVDCDGVLLDWEYAFNCFMQDQGFRKLPDADYTYNVGERYGIIREKAKSFVTIFNSSATVRFLTPLRDAVHYVKLLHEKHGYVFDVVTSLSKDKSAAKLREKNLKKLFGKSTFRKIKCLPTGANKKGYLKKYYEGSKYFWVEDKIENANDGKSVGMRSIVMEHTYNKYDKVDYPIVKNWEEIYNIVTDPVHKTYGYYGKYGEMK